MQTALITFIISLVIGAVAFSLIFRWRHDPSRTWFLLFAGALVFIPAIFLIWVFYLESRGSGASFYLFRGIFSVVQIAYPLLVSILLLLFVAVKGMETNRQEPAVARALDPRQWDLELENQDLLALMRRREWSFLIDFFIPLLPFLIAGAVASVMSARRGTTGETLFNSALLFSIVAGPIYWLCKDAIGGQSIGKRFTDLQTVDASDGRPITPGQSVARNWVFLIPLFPLIELAVASFRKDNLRIGDLLANTFVVRGPPNYVDGKLVLDPKQATAKLRDTKPVDPFGD